MNLSFFGIIFYLIIIVVFINAKKAAQSGSSRTGEHSRGNYSGQRTSASAGEVKKYISNTLEDVRKAIPDVSGDGRKTMPNVPEEGYSAKPNVPKRGYSPKPNVPQIGRTAIPNVPMRKRKERTFMELHKEESIQPKIRNNNLWGEDAHAHQRIVALRLMEGDPVPEGYVKVTCPYCAAENLVTKHCKQYHSCYFCRVPID